MPDINTLETAVFADGAIKIPENAFSGCTNLSSVIIPDTITSIGNGAFQNCSSLESFEIPNGVTTIGNRVFNYCTNLKSIKLSDNLKEIGDCAFFACKKLVSVEFSSTLVRIGNSAFDNCYGITEIKLPSGIESIGDYAFYACISLKSVTIPEKVKYLGVASFGACTSLSNAEFNAIECSTVASPFCNSDNLSSVSFGSAVARIPECLLSGNRKIQTVDIPDSVKEIGERAFFDCSGLTALTIPESVEHIGVKAFGGCCSVQTVNFNAVNCETENRGLLFVFSDCNGITTVNIGENVNSLSAYAFSGCENLERINIPDIIINIDPLAFYGCKKAAIVCASGSYANAFAVQNGMKYILSDNLSGTAFEIRNGMLIGYNGTAENVVLPSEITSIGIDAFKGNTVVKSIEIPYNISKIYSGAFANCPNLERVIIPFTVTDISSSAFTGTNAGIYCYGNSYAYNYAVANNIDYELITVTLSQSNVYVVEGESIKINAIPSVTLASGLPIVWKSSDDSVASVDSQGNIVGVSSGSTSVGAYSISGVLLDECMVSVEEPTEIEFKQASTNSLKYGEKMILHIDASNMPEGASIKWSSSNDKIVKLSGENNECGTHDGCITCTVESVGIGKAEIRATVVDSDGNPIIQNGKEVSASFEINSKAGLWQKIVAFFKKIFGLTKTIPEAFKGIL